MKSIIYFITLFCIVSAKAGTLNVVHLARQEKVSIEVKCQAVSQVFPLEHGANSGTFSLPAKPATLQWNQEKSSLVTVDTSKIGKIAVLFLKGEMPTWHVIDSKPQENKNALRIINLTTEKITLSANDQEATIESMAEKDMGKIDAAVLSVKLPSEKVRTLKPEEPCAYIAVIHRDGDKTVVHFVADR
jgi:hypothetical protein